MQNSNRMTNWSMESSHRPCNLVSYSSFTLITATSSSTAMLVERAFTSQDTSFLVEALPSLLPIVKSSGKLLNYLVFWHSVQRKYIYHTYFILYYFIQFLHVNSNIYDCLRFESTLCQRGLYCKKVIYKSY